MYQLIHINYLFFIHVGTNQLQKNQLMYTMQVSFSLKNAQSLFTVSFIFCSLKMYVEQQQQLVVDIERLRSDKADLLTRLQCCEEEFKTANECENFVIILLN